VFGGWLSTSQFIGIGMFAAAAVLFLTGRRPAAELGALDGK
jgi:hypothetical protein